METTSKTYIGLPIIRRLVLYGVNIDNLKDFVAILKTDEEFTLEAFLKLFTQAEDGYPLDILKDAFKSIEALKPEEIFSERFSNVEVRAAILKYISPEKVFLALDSKVIDKCTMTKKYPKYVIKNLEEKRDSSAIKSEDISLIYETREEHYELIEITDKRIINFLPWEYRRSSNKGILLLKMLCPSSKKTYYEYIDPTAIDFSKRKKTSTSVNIIKPGFLAKLLGATPKVEFGTTDLGYVDREKGDLIIQSLCWQMRKANAEQLTKEEYLSIKIET